jgi:hypothetical protein
MKSLEFTTNVGCMNKCAYCPQDIFLKAYGKGRKFLTVEAFNTCLKKLPEGTEIVFSGFSEPWRNKDCTAMVLAALKKFVVVIYTSLVGMKIEDAAKIVGKKFKIFCAHLPDKEGMTQIKITDEYLEVLKKCMEIPNINFSLCGTLPEKIEAIIGKKEGTTAAMQTSRGGLVQGYGRTVNHIGPISCPSQEGSHILDHNVLLPDGRVVVCCMDFGMKYVLGNLFTQDYESLFTGKVADEIRAGLRGEKDILCHHCEYAMKPEYMMKP